MKKNLAIFFILLSCMLQLENACCQAVNENFMVSGKIMNQVSDSLHAGLSGLLESQTLYIPVNKDGTFNTQIPINEKQQLFLASGDKLVTMIYVYPNDNINLEINGKTGEILKINTQNKKRTKELLFEMNFRKEFSYDFMVRHYGEVYRLSDSVTKKKGEEIRDMAREGKTEEL